MPRASLSAGAYNESSQVDKHPAVELNKGDQQRFWIPDERAGWMEYTHTIKAPAFDEKGKSIITQRPVRNGFKDVYETDFIGRPICLGDPDVIGKQKMDWDNCPVCAGVKRMLDNGIGDAVDLLPQRRYAVKVIRYDTVNRASAAKLSNPPQARLLVWGLSQWVWEKLDKVRVNIIEVMNLECEPKDVNLRQADIAVSCKTAFKTPDEITAMRPAIRAEVVKNMVKAVWGNPENHPTDAQLRAACGREPNREWMTRDVEAAERAWEKAVHPAAASPSGQGALSGGQDLLLDDDLAGLLDDTPAPAADPLADHPGGTAEFASRTQPAPNEDDDLFGSSPAPAQAAKAPATAATPDDLFGEDTPVAEMPATQSARESASVAAAPAASNGEVGSFDALESIFEDS
jgi:hypothetical protein